MAWGDWFRLIPKGEATKLARVQIDFPNSLDEAWTIDIKKSRSRPPLPVRERLRQIIAQVSGASTTVHRGRGQKLFHEITAPLWGAICRQDRHPEQRPATGRIRSTAPARETGRRRVRHLDLLLEAVSASLPVEMIYSDYSTHPRDVSQMSQVDDVRIVLRPQTRSVG